MVDIGEFLRIQNSASEAGESVLLVNLRLTGLGYPSKRNLESLDGSPVSEALF